MKKTVLLSGLLLGSLVALTGCGSEESDEIVLNVANCEEYIDLGGWDEDEAFTLGDDVEIFGENALYEDFQDWYYEQTGKRVRVEYSTYGTNEDLYNQLTIGDEFDLACPSEYMIMKMMREGMLVPYSDDFYDASIETNYYAKGESPFIDSTLKDLNIEGESLKKYAAGYMWGTLGLVYNPDVVSAEDASHWNLLCDDKYNRSVTIKDSVRDAYFAALAMNYYNEITDPEFLASDDYHDRLSEMLNRTDEETVNNAQKILTKAKNNVYSFETDAGKADMVTGKVVANEQWSGDAVYTMDQAEEDGYYLAYSCPTEGTNIWFDGWVMLKCGLEGDAEKQQAAQAFVNYISMPENVIRNMYYIGYSSCISGGESSLIYDYIDYTYGAEDDEEDVVDYPLGYFFDPENPAADEEYCICAPVEQTNRQLYAQYPPKSVVDRGVVMACFPDDGNKRVNRMWTNVRCFDFGLYGE